MASWNNHVEVIEPLVKKAGANVNLGDSDGCTPLF